MRGWVQIDVFWTSPILPGMTGPFQLFRPKNHLIPCKSWYKSHKIPILWVKNPTQIGEMHFWERWKVIFKLLLVHKQPIKLAGVHFMVKISDNSCCLTLASFWGCHTSHFWGCFTPKDSQRDETKVSNIQILVNLL